MKKLLTYLTIALSLIVGLGTNLKAEQSSPQIIVSLSQKEDDIPEKNPFGWRTPAPPTTCMVDFTKLSITADRIPLVLSYELWDETGDNMIIMLKLLHK